MELDLQCEIYDFDYLDGTDVLEDSIERVTNDVNGLIELSPMTIVVQWDGTNDGVMTLDQESRMVVSFRPLK